MKENLEIEWSRLISQRAFGETINGIITEQRQFGVFVDIGEKFNGLILAPNFREEDGILPSEYPKIGTEVEGKIIGFCENRDAPEWSYVSISLK